MYQLMLRSGQQRTGDQVAGNAVLGLQGLTNRTPDKVGDEHPFHDHIIQGDAGAGNTFFLADGFKSGDISGVGFQNLGLQRRIVLYIIFFGFGAGTAGTAGVFPSPLSKGGTS